MISALPSGLGPLRAGDRVALVAPSGPVTPAYGERAEQLLRGWGLRPVRYPSVDAVHPVADYLAGPDAVRAKDFSDAWLDQGIAGVFCVRGGYGSVRILDLLDAAALRAGTPKPVYGSSDITALLEWLREKLGVAGWFTPMIATGDLLDDEIAIAALRTAVLDGPVGRWTSSEAQIVLPGTATGITIGGNLSLLAMTLGARGRQVDNTGALALLEDVNEETYKVDGYLQSLLRAGWFDGVRGVVLGSWRDCQTADGIRELCRETLAPLGIPVVWELGFGHGPGAHSIPLGVPATLLAEPGHPPELILQESRRG